MQPAHAIPPILYYGGPHPQSTDIRVPLGLVSDPCYALECSRRISDASVYAIHVSGAMSAGCRLVQVGNGWLLSGSLPSESILELGFSWAFRTICDWKSSKKS